MIKKHLKVFGLSAIIGAIIGIVINHVKSYVKGFKDGKERFFSEWLSGDRDTFNK